MKPEQAPRYRTERDPLGEKRVPDDVLYGVQTLRALETFQISGLRMEHSLITAIAEIKKAAALAHLESGELDEPVGKAIIDAAGEIIDGQWCVGPSLGSDALRAGRPVGTERDDALRCVRAARDVGNHAQRRSYF